MSNTSIRIAVLRDHLRVALSIVTRVCPVKQKQGYGSPYPHNWIDGTVLIPTVNGDEQPQNEDEQVDVS